MRPWFVLFPGSAYAGEFYGEDIDEAKQAAGDWLGVKRLPSGTAIWPKSPSHDDALMEDVKRNPELYRDR